MKCMRAVFFYIHVCFSYVFFSFLMFASFRYVYKTLCYIIYLSAVDYQYRKVEMSSFVPLSLLLLFASFGVSSEIWKREMLLQCTHTFMYLYWNRRFTLSQPQYLQCTSVSVYFTRKFILMPHLLVRCLHAIAAVR